LADGKPPKDDKRLIIRNSQLFWDLTDSQIDKLLAIYSEEHHVAGQSIMAEGDAARDIYIVADGKVALQMEIRIGSRTRKQAVIDVISQGQVFGRSAISNTPVSDMSATCTEDTLLFAFDGGKLNRLMDEDHDMYRKVMQEMVNLVSDRLSHAKQTLAHVLSVTSHDLRAPLATVQSCLDVVSGGFAGEVNPKQLDLLQGSKQRISDLTNMIDNLLDISYIDLKEQSFEDVSLAEVITNSLDDVFGIAKNKNIRLISQVTADLPTVLGLPKRLRQVITNLLSNAVKFSSEGDTITVSAFTNDDAVQVDVADTGIGITPEELPRIFDDFYRGMKVDAEGAGLGLSIAKKVVGSHGGRIWVQSPDTASGIGTRFSFTIPKFASPKTETPEKKSIIENARILIADDDPSMRKVVSFVLESRKALVFTAVDGEDALAKVAEVKPDLLILDLLMPKMDGFEVCKRLNEQAGGGHRVPILITSAVREDSSRRRYELETESDLNVDGYMEKPLSPPLLIQRVETILSKYRSRGS
jgi:signal transduction histidine kinase/AmiR/NasT family two-component response regulator